MERIKLGEINKKDGEIYSVFAVLNGFEYTFEMNGEDGYEASYDSLEELMVDVFLFTYGIGFYRLRAITRKLLKGENPQLDEDEREVLE